MKKIKENLIVVLENLSGDLLKSYGFNEQARLVNLIKPITDVLQMIVSLEKTN